MNYMKKNKIQILTKQDLSCIIGLLGYSALIILGYILCLILKSFFTIRIVNIFYVCWFVIVSFLYSRIIHKYTARKGREKLKSEE